MALSGVPIKGRNVGKIKLLSTPKDDGKLKTMTELKEALTVQVEAFSDIVKSYQDFVEQYSGIVNSDLDDIKKACEEMGMKLKSNTPQRDMLAYLFDSMFKEMVNDPSFPSVEEE